MLSHPFEVSLARVSSGTHVQCIICRLTHGKPQLNLLYERVGEEEAAWSSGLGAGLVIQALHPAASWTNPELGKLL